MLNYLIFPEKEIRKLQGVQQTIANVMFAKREKCLCNIQCTVYLLLIIRIKNHKPNICVHFFNDMNECSKSFILYCNIFPKRDVCIMNMRITKYNAGQRVMHLKYLRKSKNLFMPRELLHDSSYTTGRLNWKKHTTIGLQYK